MAPGGGSCISRTENPCGAFHVDEAIQDIAQCDVYWSYPFAWAGSPISFNGHSQNSPSSIAPMKIVDSDEMHRMSKQDERLHGLHESAPDGICTSASAALHAKSADRYHAGLLH